LDILNFVNVKNISCKPYVAELTDQNQGLWFSAFYTT